MMLTKTMEIDLAAERERAKEFPNLYVLQHPLVMDKVSRMRDETTSTGEFRQLMKQVGVLLGYEVTRDLALEYREINTPLVTTHAPFLQKPMVAIVPVLRAGTGLADGLLELMPSAKMGNIGLYRDEDTNRPVEYMVKLPSSLNRRFLLVDPMLATGHTAVYATDVLIQHGVKREHIRVMALLTTPEGMRVFNQKYADIPVYCAAIDPSLNAQNFIVPGIGDAGDRLYGTL